MNLANMALRILIVDDDEVDREALSRVLRKISPKVNILQASTAREGYRLISESELDCIFLDYLLPGGDGVNLLKRIRAAGKHVPVIMVTSQGDEKVAVEVMKSGGSDYLSKDALVPDKVRQLLRASLRAWYAEEDRRRAEEALRMSQARLEEAQRIARIGNFEVDLLTMNIFWSNEVFRIFGWEPGSFTPTFDTYLQNLDPGDKYRAKEVFDKAIEAGEPFSMDLKFRHDKGGEVYVEFQARPEKDGEGRTIRLIGTVQDISERKRIEEALIEAREQALSSARAKEEFLANMSHELRTPINAILGFTHLLHDTGLGPEQLEYIDAIDTSGELLLELINDILDLAKIESGKMNFVSRSFRLDTLIEGIQDVFLPSLWNKPVQLISEIDPAVPPVLKGDPMRLRQVLLNLVGNAVKFTHEGEVKLSVRHLGAEDGQHELRFTVTDTGIGIPAAKQAEIFDSFAQAHTDTSREYGGTGLGLTICKRIVELQGGRIGMHSEEGRGSEFYVELEFGTGKEEAPRREVPATPAEPEQACHVLLIEDNALNRRLVRAMLEHTPYRLTEAASGPEGMEALEREIVDIVLLDIHLPGADGFEVVERIRSSADENVKDIPVIAMTAHLSENQRQKCIAYGMDGCLPKPFKPDNFWKVIREWSGKRHGSSGTPDYDGLQEISEGNREFETDLARIFVEEVPAAIRGAIDKLAASEWREVYRLIHGIKPSMRLFGVQGSLPLIEWLEQAIEKEEPGACEPLLNELLAISERASEQIRTDFSLSR